MIYFITDGEFIKVGTAKNVRARLSGLMSGNARKLVVLTTCQGDKRLEKRLHHVLPRRVPGMREWFRPSDPLTELISSIQQGDRSVQYLDSLVADMEATKAAQKVEARADRRASKAEFLARSTAMMNRLCEKHGAAKVLAYSGQTASALAFQRAGKMIPGSLVIARLGVLDPDEVWELTCPGIPRLAGAAGRTPKPATMVPDLKAMQRLTNTLLARAEALGIAA